MFKTLLKKQLLEFCKVFFFNRRSGTYRFDKGSVIGRIILFGFIYISLAGAFFMMAVAIGGNLMSPKLSWIYFMIMCMMAFLLGIIANAFSASTQLFQAKDNEFLLSLPITPTQILLSRMVTVYILGLVYESMVLLPAMIFYFVKGHPSLLSVILCILSFFILGFLVLTFSCLLGWLIALISSKLRNKSFLSVIVSVIVIGLFFWFRISANSLFRGLALHAKDFGKSVEGWGYPLYAVGLGMSGNIVGFLAFTGIVAVLFLLTCFILNKSFRMITAEKNNAVKGIFSMQQVKTRSINSALRKKEMKRFTTSPAYMLNCGMGILFLLAGGVFLLIKAGDARQIAEGLQGSIFLNGRGVPALAAFLVCLFLPLCDISAPAISLEGRSVWILQSLPVDPFAVFRAKLYVHLSVTILPALFGVACTIIVFRPPVFAAVCMVLCVLSFLLLTATSQLALDLKRPIMDWTSEIQPIKQNLSILFDFLGGMALAGILAGIYFIVGRFTGPEVYLLICTALFILFSFLLLRWMAKKGRTIFANL